MWRIPLMIYRSGTSRGSLFLASDLDVVPKNRDLVCAYIMGSGHPYQLDGIGGGRSSTAKSLWIQKAQNEAFDIECKFVQTEIDKFGVDNSHGDCGNMLASVGPFAIEKGLVKAEHPLTTVKMLSLNTRTTYKIEVCTYTSSNGIKVQYAGNQKISGVPGVAAPVKVFSSNMAGAVTGKLLPTGNVTDTISIDSSDIEVSCVDFSRPMVICQASSVNMTGFETKQEVDKNVELNELMDKIRIEAAKLMGMGDVRGQASPKICVVSPPQDDKQNLSTRYFTAPYNQDLHYALAMTAAQSIAASCMIKGTISNRLCRFPDILPSSTENEKDFEVIISHPKGTAQIFLRLLSEKYEVAPEFINASYIRTVRPILTGEAFYPM